MSTAQIIVIMTGFFVWISMGETHSEYRKRNANRHSSLLLSRDNRAASADPRKNCSTWTSWVNEHTPSSSDKTESESMTSQALAEFCPITYGGRISKFECNDQRGEAFNTSKTSGNNDEFFIDCRDVNIGATCKVIKTTTDPCPDLSVKYYCTCSSQVPLTTESTTRRAATKSFTTESTVTNHERVERFNLCGMTIAWWVFILVLCLILFVLNALLTLCLYKRALKTMKRKKIKVHPLEKV